MSSGDRRGRNRAGDGAALPVLVERRRDVLAAATGGQVLLHKLTLRRTELVHVQR